MTKERFNLLKLVIGKLLRLYLSHVETKAWKQINIDQFYSVLSWGLGQEWIEATEVESFEYANEMTKQFSIMTGNVRGRYYSYYVDSFLMGHLLKSRFKKLIA